MAQFVLKEENLSNIMGARGFQNFPIMALDQAKIPILSKPSFKV